MTREPPSWRGRRRPVRDHAVILCSRRFVASHKCAPPFAEAELEIRHGTGVDTLAELELELARGVRVAQPTAATPSHFTTRA